MIKTLAVFGATGRQGGALINNLLQDAELSKQFKIRAITRSIGSDTAEKLEEKVDVVQGDASDPASLTTALAGVHTVFAMTVPSWGPDATANFSTEVTAGKAIADAAVAQGAQYIIFSTLPSPSKISSGRFQKVHHFESKVVIEDYIRGLPIKSAFVSLGTFMTNFADQVVFKPTLNAATDTWEISLPNSPQAKYPLVDIVNDMGKYVGAILAEPDKYEGKTFCAATRHYSLTAVAETLAEVSGKKVVLRRLSPEEFLVRMPMPADGINEIFRFTEEIGYWGPDSEKLMAWAAENARGKLTTLRDFLKSSNFTLE